MEESLPHCSIAGGPGSLEMVHRIVESFQRYHSETLPGSARLSCFLLRTSCAYSRLNIEMPMHYIVAFALHTLCTVCGVRQESMESRGDAISPCLVTLPRCSHSHRSWRPIEHQARKMTGSKEPNYTRIICWSHLVYSAIRLVNS
jgi:hypothetical protein